MRKYYVNTKAQANGDHEVHRADCIFLPTLSNRRYLGEFNSCREAVAEAKKIYASADGCKICSYACHTK
ncbi:hypothetical protein H8S90_10145 [Olivibacter sp. SDN3]|uniref:hypothetical protein n=1 Tax=Olivibacter sp. SDN3 TaxID=2764720 RepID=UPI0016516544|nr:hypothetical protein [Olivibacter sp. SDN3]QNL51900.1 hypothetical protein H8S90_10145 [Olivibacter sp. SDN3]